MPCLSRRIPLPHKENQMEQSAGRIPALDGLRALSILLVLWCHGSLTRGAPGHFGWERWLGDFGLLHGEFGVSVFFVISGYLITTLLMKEREQTGRISLGSFYVRRAFRIFPAAYLYLLVITVLEWHSIAKLPLLAGWLYGMDFIRKRPWDLLHLWSLGVEEQFYLLWPAALILFWKQKEKIAMGAILAAPLFRIAFRFGGLHGIMQYAFPCVEDALAAGCLLAMCRNRIPTKRVDRWILPILIFALAVNQFHFPFGVYPLLLQTPRNLCIALLVDHCIRKEYRVLNWRPMVWLGSISYSLYLWQMPFMNAVGWLHPGRLWLDFPYNMGCALVVGCGSFYLVERPVLRLRDRIFRRPYVEAKVAVAVG